MQNFSESQSALKVEIEVDESYFGAKPIKGKRGRGAYKKTPVFGIFKRGGKVYTEVVLYYAKATLQIIIRGRVDAESVIHSDGWRGYDGLADLGYEKHYRLTHAYNEFARGRSHINGIGVILVICETTVNEVSWHRRIDFFPRLEECEFRFNYLDENIYLLLLKMFRTKPLC